MTIRHPITAASGALGVAASALLCSATMVAGQASEADEPSLPISSISGDWNGDGALDGALLFTSVEGASLFVYLGGQDGSKRTSVLARDLVWHGQGVAGQEATLERAADRRIVVTSQNSAIGRDRWSERLVLAYEAGALRVVRYERIAYDTLDLDWRQECELDFVTGKGSLNGRSLSVAMKAPLAKDWSIESAPPPICDVN